MKINRTRPEIPDDHPIIEALRNGDVETVRHYLNDGISPYTIGLITGAIGSGSVEIVKLFLDCGMDVNFAFNVHGETPIFRLIEKKNMAILRLLVEKGADINGDPTGGGTVLHKAAYLWPEGAAFLLDVGADANARATDGRTPVMAAAFGNQIKSLEILHSAGGRLEDRDNGGTTPLILAARAGKQEAIQWLLNHGADILAEDYRGKTAEDWAKENGHVAITQYLNSQLGS